MGWKNEAEAGRGRGQGKGHVQVQVQVQVQLQGRRGWRRLEEKEQQKQVHVCAGWQGAVAVCSLR